MIWIHQRILGFYWKNKKNCANKRIIFIPKQISRESLLCNARIPAILFLLELVSQEGNHCSFLYESKKLENQYFHGGILFSEVLFLYLSAGASLGKTKFKMIATMVAITTGDLPKMVVTLSGNCSKQVGV